MDMNAPRRDRLARYADMMSAMGAGPRLRIMRELLSAHPGGLVVGEIQANLRIPGPTLSHHLDRLKTQGLVRVRREGTFLRYSANADVLRELLGFLFAECCSRSGAVDLDSITRLCEQCRPRGPRTGD